jgi:hypothetical protein
MPLNMLIDSDDNRRGSFAECYNPVISRLTGEKSSWPDLVVGSRVLAANAAISNEFLVVFF